MLVVKPLESASLLPWSPSDLLPRSSFLSFLSLFWAEEEVVRLSSTALAVSKWRADHLPPGRSGPHVAKAPTAGWGWWEARADTGTRAGWQDRRGPQGLTDACHRPEAVPAGASPPRLPHPHPFISFRPCTVCCCLVTKSCLTPLRSHGL